MAAINQSGPFTLREVHDRMKSIDGTLSISKKAMDGIRSGLMAFGIGDVSAVRCIVLWGCPGAGKSHAAKAIANTVGKSVEVHDIGTLKEGSIGSTGKGINAMMKRTSEMGSSVIIIDEADLLFPSKTQAREADSTTREAVGAMLPWLDGSRIPAGRVLVILTSNSKNYDEALIDRADAVIEVEPPGKEVMRIIVAKLLKKYNMNSSSSSIDNIVSEASGLNPRDLDYIVRELRRQSITECENAQSLSSLVLQRRKSLSTMVECLELSKVVLPGSVKNKLLSYVHVSRNAQKVASMGMKINTRPLLLVGQPGTGKTLIGKAMANEFKSAFMAVGLDDLKSGFVGHSAAKVASVFSRARQKTPTLLFIDEIETITRVRGNEYGSISDDVVASMLVELDGIKSGTGSQPFILAATNHPELIDPAILSRFDMITIPLPSQIIRYDIVLNEFAKAGFHDPRLDLVARITRLTDGGSGRDIAKIVNGLAVTMAVKSLAAGRRIEPTVDDLDISIKAQRRDVA